MSNSDQQRAALQQAVRDDPLNASLHYRLGAELAQLREYDAAVSEMSHALALDPGLHTARFQLGLLYLTMARPTQSIETWALLEAQPDVALRQFKRGLEALIRDDFAECLEALEAGMRANETNPPLNGDMQLIVVKVRELVARNNVPPPPPSSAQPEPEQGPSAVRTDFSLYEPGSR